MALRQAIDGVMKKQDLRSYVENHKELAMALRKWL